MVRRSRRGARRLPHRTEAARTWSKREPNESEGRAVNPNDDDEVQLNPEAVALVDLARRSLGPMSLQQRSRGLAGFTARTAKGRRHPAFALGGRGPGDRRGGCRRARRSESMAPLASCDPHLRDRGRAPAPKESAGGGERRRDPSQVLRRHRDRARQRRARARSFGHRVRSDGPPRRGRGSRARRALGGSRWLFEQGPSS